jgi:drug/metabolite transporter (DMT)-like permease
VRFLLAAAVMGMFVHGRTQSRQALHTRSLWVIGIILGSFLFMGYALQTLGLQTIAPAISGFLTGLNVILVPIMAIPLLHRAPSHKTWMAAALALLGLALLNGISSMGHWSSGEIFTLGCAVFIALQMVYVDKWAPGLDSIALTAVEIGTVAVLSLFISLIHPDSLLHWHAWDHLVVWSAVVVNGVLGSAFAYWAQTRYQQMTSATYVAVIFTMEPVFAAVIAVLFLHEALRLPVVFGGALIVGSMLLADGAEVDHT